MALLHSIETEIGVNATYFHIDRMNVRPRERVVEVVINGFVDKDKRLACKNPIFTTLLLFSYDEIETALEVQVTDITQEILYTFLKTTTEFNGATDDI